MTTHDVPPGRSGLGHTAVLAPLLAPLLALLLLVASSAAATSAAADEEPTDPPEPEVFVATITVTAGSGPGTTTATRGATKSASAERDSLTEKVTRTYKGRRFTGSGSAVMVHHATVTLERTAEVAWEETTATATWTCEVTTTQQDADDCATEQATALAVAAAQREADRAAKPAATELARETALLAAQEAADAAALTEPVTDDERAVASKAARKIATADAKDKVQWWRLTHELTPRLLTFDVREGDRRAYIGGQGLRLYGSLGVRGKRKVVVEAHLNRPGDTWQPLPGGVSYAGRTRSNGFFLIPIQAPSMFDISYRVRSGRLVSPPVLFNAKTQDVDLRVEGSTDWAEPVQPVAGEEFSIVADTAADFYKRPTTQGLPILQGRTVTLLRRSSPTRWSEVASGRVGADGRFVFGGLVEDEPGDVVYRVRAEEWREDGSRIGWTSSWPLAVHVRGPLEPPSYVPEGAKVPGNQVERRGPKPKNDNAFSRYGWGPFRWNYDWTRGESIDAKPSTGTQTSGRWTEVGTGLGRVVRMNGGLMISSGKLVKDGRGDVGTTSALLEGAAASTGRWEATMSLTTAEKKDADYDAVLELVPASGADRPCAPVVTIARWTGLDKKMTLGVDNGDQRWQRSVRTKGPGYSIPIVAVEVAKDHLTWFVNGKPVATVRDRAAWPGEPLTLRMSLVGDEREHDNTSLFSDWQRSFTLDRGRQVTSGKKVSAFARPGC